MQPKLKSSEIFVGAAALLALFIVFKTCFGSTDKNEAPSVIEDDAPKPLDSLTIDSMKLAELNDAISYAEL